MSNNTTPADRLVDAHQGATRVHVGTDYGEPDSAVIPHDANGHIVVTPDYDQTSGYLVGIYDGDAYDTFGDPEIAVAMSVAELEEAVGFLLGEQPEGTDWSAWATYWLTEIAECPVVAL